MFSWSQSQRQQRRTTTTSTYPAQRTARTGGISQSQSGPPVLAQTVQGSIRPPTNASQNYTRQQHIDSYLNDATLQRSTRKVSADDSTYDTVFQTTTGNALILRVHIGGGSSSSQVPCPAMTLVGVKVRHAWLDARMRVTGYAPIQNDTSWQQCDLLLGTAVHQVVQHLQLQPPEILEITDAGLQQLQQRLGGATGGGSSRSGNNGSTVAAPPDYSTLFEAQLPDMPTIPSDFPVLQSKSRDELQKLMRNDVEFQQLLESLPVYSQYQGMALSVVEENAQVALANLDEEVKLKELHSRVSKLQTSLGQKLNEYEQLEKNYHSLTAPPDAKDVMKQLNKGKREAFEESEQLADTWVESATAVDELPDFLERFLEIRQVHHARAAKIERLQQEQVR